VVRLTRTHAQYQNLPGPRTNLHRHRTTTVSLAWLDPVPACGVQIGPIESPVLDEVYQRSAGVPLFHEVSAPSSAQLRELLERIITRIMKWLTLPKAI